MTVATLPSFDGSLPLVTGAPAWRGDGLEQAGDWIYRLSDAELDELERLGTLFVETDPDLRTVKAADYPLVECAGAVKRWGEDLDYGRGFNLGHRLISAHPDAG